MFGRAGLCVCARTTGKSSADNSERGVNKPGTHQPGRLVCELKYSLILFLNLSLHLFIHSFICVDFVHFEMYIFFNLQTVDHIGIKIKLLYNINGKYITNN